MNRILGIRFFLLIVLVMIGGCTAMPARQSLGLARGESDNRIERLISSLILIDIPYRKDAKGVEVEMPEALGKSGLVGVSKEFTDFSGNSAQLTRKAFQGADQDGNMISVYLSSGKAYAFSAREMRKITVLSPNGDVFSISPIRVLSEEEIDQLYENIAAEFPKTSVPLEGSETRFSFGPEALFSINVPQTVTFQERGAITGLGSIVLTPNVYGLAVSKFIAFFRTRTMSRTAGTLAEAPAVATVTETSLFLGGDR